MREITDDFDKEILRKRQAAFDAVSGPRVGDFVRMKDGSLRRFTHDWGDTIQTTSPGYGGSFYLGDGYAEFSGALDPGLNKAALEATEDAERGSFWFFTRGIPRAHSGVRFEIPCRVFKEVANA